MVTQIIIPRVPELVIARVVLRVVVNWILSILRTHEPQPTTTQSAISAVKVG